MSALKTRIARQSGRTPPLTPAEGRPVGNGQTPGAVLQIVPGVGAGIGPLSPIITADGAAIPATGPGQWDQLVAAGRP